MVKGINPLKKEQKNIEYIYIEIRHVNLRMNLKAMIFTIS